MSEIRKPKRRGSMRGAINAFCRYCIYDPNGGNGTWREQVSACTSPDCPLYDFRPKTSAKGAVKSGSVDIQTGIAEGLE